MNRVSGRGEGLSPDVLREAAAWFASMADASASDEQKQTWRSWLAADPDHLKAWRRVEEVMGQLVPLTRTGKAAGKALVTPQRKKRKLLGALGVLFLAAGTGGILTRLPWQEWRTETAMRRADYRNGIGRLTTTVLQDGTRIWLGSLAILDYRYDVEVRLLHMFRGDLVVETATDRVVPARPFIVATPHGRLRALGTRFAVRVDTANSRIDVFEGAIEVTAAGGDRPLHVVHAGEHAVFDGRDLLAVGQASPAREAWSRGILAADRLRLDHLVAELARWHPVPIACDADVAGLQVVGAYPLQDLDRILAALDDSLPVRIVRDEGRVRIAAGAARPLAPGTSTYDTPPRRIE